MRPSGAAATRMRSECYCSELAYRQTYLVIVVSEIQANIFRSIIFTRYKATLIAWVIDKDQISKLYNLLKLNTHRILCNTPKRISKTIVQIFTQKKKTQFKTLKVKSISSHQTTQSDKLKTESKPSNRQGIYDKY